MTSLNIPVAYIPRNISAQQLSAESRAWLPKLADYCGFLCHPARAYGSLAHSIACLQHPFGGSRPNVLLPAPVASLVPSSRLRFPLDTRQHPYVADTPIVSLTHHCACSLMVPSRSRDKLDDALTRLAVKQLRFKRRSLPSPRSPPPVTQAPTAHRSVLATREVVQVTHVLCSPSSVPHDHVLSTCLSPLQISPPPPATTPPTLPLSMRTSPSPIDLWLPGPRSGVPRLSMVLRVNRHSPGTSECEQNEHVLTVFLSPHRLQAP